MVRLICNDEIIEIDPFSTTTVGEHGEEYFVIQRIGGSCAFEPADENTEIEHNGTVSVGDRLANGDVIRVAGKEYRFESEKVKPVSKKKVVVEGNKAHNAPSIDADAYVENESLPIGDKPTVNLGPRFIPLLICAILIVGVMTLIMRSS